MASLIENREKFFARYNISEEDFNKTGIQWGDLKQIYDDYLNHRESLETAGETIAKILRSHSLAHSVRMRIKDPEHLIEKLVRKKIKNKEFTFDLKNYKEKITDLIGLRVLHISKKDAEGIDHFIREHWPLREATIYYREGDFIQPELMQRFECKQHEASYRSWHYLIEYNLTQIKTYTAEIQVRTIFEEGWSEIDHKLRYPYYVDDVILNNQLQVLNRLAGSADEMVDSIQENLSYISEMDKKQKELKKEREEIKKELEELRSTIEQMDVQQPQKDSLIDSLDKIEDKTVSTYSIKHAHLLNPVPSSVIEMMTTLQAAKRSAIMAGAKFRNPVPNSVIQMAAAIQNIKESAISLNNTKSENQKSIEE
ncbi:hypothetical protein P9293_21480 [Bacillus inaquosorum]|uniref:hypothetical protein n=1 Tax=Bacillus inaquosorum TaxID=483913 RepID=UPI000318E8C4|nr:hypothetical protein [Bacillus inaquosorum]MED4649906.1 hypothetical protein [Bacillus inaquosorum]MED4793339.1 hypothetical protein [Bacillus inaquosorum]